MKGEKEISTTLLKRTRRLRANVCRSGIRKSPQRNSPWARTHITSTVLKQFRRLLFQNCYGNEERGKFPLLSSLAVSEFFLNNQTSLDSVSGRTFNRGNDLKNFVHDCDMSQIDTRKRILFCLVYLHVIDPNPTSRNRSMKFK